MKIGILEDDLTQAALICEWLRTQGHEVFHTTAGNEFLLLIQSQPIDIAILDWEAPDPSGISLLKVLREKLRENLPVLFTTHRDDEQDIVKALLEGADDYLVKPLRKAELLARITALGRRAGIERSNKILTLGPIEINLTQQVVIVSGEIVKLTNKDYQLACCLLQNVDKLLSRKFLLKEVWGLGPNLNTRTVDMHISRVKRSLRIGRETGYYIRTIYQHGYRLEKLPD